MTPWKGNPGGEPRCEACGRRGNPRTIAKHVVLVVDGRKVLHPALCADCYATHVSTASTVEDSR